jgi:hypothetical protein
MTWSGVTAFFDRMGADSRKEQGSFLVNRFIDLYRFLFCVPVSALPLACASWFKSSATLQEDADLLANICGTGNAKETGEPPSRHALAPRPPGHLVHLR